MLRNLIDHPTPELRAGEDYEYPVLKGCPDCNGRGWIYENPFAEKWAKTTRACSTCWHAKKYFDQHGELPDDIASAISNDKQHRNFR
jgi:hypothetical protein